MVWYWYDYMVLVLCNLDVTVYEGFFDILVGISLDLMEKNEEVRLALPFCNTNTTHFCFWALEN